MNSTRPVKRSVDDSGEIDTTKMRARQNAECAGAATAR
jgi:hypothetical protein